MNFKPLSEKEESIAKKIVDAAYTVHKALGPGLLEKVYSPCGIRFPPRLNDKVGQVGIPQGKVCFCHELPKRGLKYKRQVNVPIIYDGLVFDEGLQLDVLAEDLIICELKAVDKINPVWEAQLLSHLRLTGKKLGFLINFNVPLIKNGIKRIIV